MRILVTGGAGYIGSITARLLLDEGHEVVVLDTLERGWREAVDRRARFEPGDVGDRQILDWLLPGCDAVVHLAGYIEVAESQVQPARYFDNNVARPLALLEAMAEHGVGSLVYSSSAAVYGVPEETPILEDAPTAPINAYGTSKLMFERMLGSFESAYGLRSIGLRYFNVAGAQPDGTLGEAHCPETHLIPKVLRAIADGERTFEVFGGDYPTDDGTCVRDYVHVLDVARAHSAAVRKLAGGGSGGVFNLGNGVGHSNLEVVSACGDVAGRGIEAVIGERRPGDPAVLVAAPERAQRELGWEAERGELRTMIEDAWRWMQANPGGYAFCRV